MTNLKTIAILLCGIGGTGKSTTTKHLDIILKKNSYKVMTINFDEMRKKLTPVGVDPFSKDFNVKNVIYQRAINEFQKLLQKGVLLIIDSGLSNEKIRKNIKNSIKELKIVHLYCPVITAVYRDTKRSFLRKPHERGWFLHLHAIVDLMNPFKKNKFPQPGITYPFEYPECADVHVSTFLKSPHNVAKEILIKLQNNNYS